MNTNTNQGDVVTSYDPNEMAGPIGFGDTDPNAAGAKRYVLPGQWLEYKVYFENKSTATAAAQEVKVDADLSPHLDWTTFEIGDIVVGNQTITELTGSGKGRAIVPLQGRSDSLMVTVTLNAETGHVKWYLRAYDKTQAANGFWPENAEDGFLPPNDEFHSGEGHCSYRIRVKETGVSHGDVINAAAEIVFDSNPMIPTDPAWYNTIYSQMPMTPTAPAEGAVGIVPPDATFLSWLVADGAETYNVELQLMNGSSVDQTWTATGLKMNAWDLPVVLIDGRTYRWRVTAVNAIGSAQGDYWSFEVRNTTVIGRQTLNLAAGWNWVSFNVLPSSHKVGDVLGTAGFTANDVIQTNGGMARFTGTSWTPGGFTVEFGKLYQIHVAKAVKATVSGEACGTSAVPLSSGWNWIGNPTAQAVTPSQLTHSGGWTAGDRIQAAGGVSVTYTGSKWVPSTGFTLEPGKGCQLYAAKGGTLSFPSAGADDALYVVVDLSGGAEAASYPVRYTNTPPDLDDDTCRTTELWLRKIPAGTFIMGSPEDEVGRDDNETQHQVTLTQEYYMGVFECTQKQWELVMGSNPSSYIGDNRPVVYVSYNMIRGTGSQAGAGWPTYGHTVNPSSFMGRLQEKTGLTFDLPTEAQWEYACRAGTTTALNSGKNLIGTGHQDAAMDEVGRYGYNDSDGKGGYSHHTKVGSYLPNAWGLYDMHGNVDEWCLDWYKGSYGTAAVSDPVGPNTGSYRVWRGGSWGSYARNCRSAHRSGDTPSNSGGIGSIGFRVLCLPRQDLYVVVDLSGGAEAASYPVRYTNEAPDLDDDTCRTTELWLRKIPKGTFTMGSPEDEVGRIADRETQHEVTLTQDYYMGVFECTQRQWELVMGTKPSHFNNATYYETRPVECVSYNTIRGTGTQAGAGWPTYGHAVDATSFMGRLQAKTGLVFDLPTEAQWEYAARGGSESKGYTYSGSNNIVAVAWYFSNSGSQTHDVGTKEPNELGLYDMSGNVDEWCLDWYGTCRTAAVSDPVGPNSGSYRVYRGGCWVSNAFRCRSADRYYYFYPSNYGSAVGFRVVCLP